MEGIGATLSAAVMIIPTAVLSNPVPVILCLTLADFLISLSLTQHGYWVTPFYVTAGTLFSATILWAFVINPEQTVLDRS